MTDNNTCMVEECSRPVVARKLCRSHYHSWYYGSLDIDVPTPLSRKEAGRLGGLKKTDKLKGFAANRELARIAGTRGGRISRRKAK